MAPQPVSRHASSALDIEYPPQDEEHVFPSVLRTASFHFLRGAATQVLPKTASLGLFTALAAESTFHAVKTGVAAAATFAGAASGSWVFGNIARHQVDTDTAAGKAAVALSGIAGAAAGVGFALGSLPAVAAVGAATFSAAALLGTARLVAHCKGRDVSRMTMAVAILSGVGVGAATFWYGGFVWPGDIRQHASGVDESFVARQMAIAYAESFLVEVIKQQAATCGPSIDRKGLTHEGRIFATLKGLPFYVAAGVLINGEGGSALLAQNLIGVPIKFNDQVGAVLLSCIPNGLRDLGNALAAYHTWPDHRRGDAPDNPMAYEAPDRSTWEKASSIGNKTSVRAFLNLAKNTIQISLIAAGYSTRTATMIAQTAYIALGAQWRDVIVDLMEGAGWTQSIRAADGIGDLEPDAVSSVNAVVTTVPVIPVIHMPVTPEIADPPLRPPWQRSISQAGPAAFRARLQTDSEPRPTRTGAP